MTLRKDGVNWHRLFSNIININNAMGAVKKQAQ